MMPVSRYYASITLAIRAVLAFKTSGIASQQLIWACIADTLAHVVRVVNGSQVSIYAGQKGMAGFEGKCRRHGAA
jgi:hypothetical protein